MIREFVMREVLQQSERLRASSQQCYYFDMRTILPFAGVILALIAAGSIAFVAWELTKDATREGGEGESDDE